jgi:hypothetical protein
MGIIINGFASKFKSFAGLCAGFLPPSGQTHEKTIQNAETA